MTKLPYWPHAKSRLKVRKIKNKIRNVILGMYQQSFYGFFWNLHFFVSQISLFSRATRNRTRHPSKSLLSTSWECEREMLCTFNNLHFILFLSHVRSLNESCKFLYTFCGFSFNWKVRKIRSRCDFWKISNQTRLVLTHCMFIVGCNDGGVITSGSFQRVLQRKIGQRSKVHPIKYLIYASPDTFMSTVFLNLTNKLHFLDRYHLPTQCARQQWDSDAWDIQIRFHGIIAARPIKI